MILEQTTTKRCNEMFLRMTEQEAVCLINVLSRLLIDPKPGSSSFRLHPLSEDDAPYLNVSVWTEEQYDKMLGG